MKGIYQLEIYPVNTFFPKERIDNKLQIIKILLEATRYILTLSNEIKDSVNKKPKLIFYKSKMSRLFFISDLKMYSIRFPFSFIKRDDEIIISFKNIVIDNEKVSKVITLLNNLPLLSSNCLEFIEPISEMEEEYWVLVRELLLMEDGYIRYDKDEDGYNNAKSKKEEDKHPLNHLDIFYSNEITCKVGLKNDLIDSEFIDILDRESSCKHLI